MLRSRQRGRPSTKPGEEHHFGWEDRQKRGAHKLREESISGRDEWPTESDTEVGETR